MRSQDSALHQSALRGKKLGLHYKPEAEVACSNRKWGLLLKVLREVKYITPVKTVQAYNLDLTACVYMPLILNLQPREGADSI